MIKPNPSMKETQLMHEDMHEALATVFEALRKGKLVYKANKGCHIAVNQVQMADPNKTGYTPPIYALMCMVNGLLRFPYRERKTPSIEPIIPKYLYEFEKGRIN